MISLGGGTKVSEGSTVTPCVDGDERILGWIQIGGRHQDHGGTVVLAVVQGVLCGGNPPAGASMRHLV
jgi:hypothetical protein